MHSHSIGYATSDVIPMPNIVEVLCNSSDESRPCHARLATQADAAFMFELFCNVRELEFQHFDAAMAQQLLALQFTARTATYESRFPDNVSLIIQSLDEKPIGRLQYWESDSTVHLIDIALLASHRNCGIGSHVLQILQQTAAEKSCSVTLSVARQNPAMSLYRRLGFTENGGDEVYGSMIWRANSKIERTEKMNYE